LTGEGQGEGEESRNFKKSFIPLSFIPSRQGRGNFTFYAAIKIDFTHSNPLRFREERACPVK
jgi:hypothetical protein